MKNLIGPAIEVLIGLIPSLIKPDPARTLRRLEKNRDKIQSDLDAIQKRLAELRNKK